ESIDRPVGNDPRWRGSGRRSPSRGPPRRCRRHATAPDGGPGPAPVSRREPCTPTPGGGQSAREIERRAIAGRARELYGSAVPSVPAVVFYLAHGFRVTEEVDPDLFAQEPEDIHLVKPMNSTS